MAWDSTKKEYRPELPESLWIIDHDLDTTVPTVDVWIQLNPAVEEYTAMIPLETRVVNSGTVHISFSSPILGIAKLY